MANWGEEWAGLSLGRLGQRYPMCLESRLCLEAKVRGFAMH